MIDKFIADFHELMKFIRSQRNYIRSAKSKALIKNFYERSWLPYSLDFKEKFGNQKFKIIEENLYKAYNYSKKDYFEKKKVLNLLLTIEPILEEIRLESIRKYGYVIEISKKQIIVELLKNKNFSGTLHYLREAEIEYTKEKWKQSCFNSRLALEEFLRELREKISKKDISGGTVGDHIHSLKNKLNLTNSEVLLIKNGFYGFLSNKGGHATTDKPTREDAKMSIYLLYICFEYFLEKFSKSIQ